MFRPKKHITKKKINLPETLYQDLEVTIKKENQGVRFFFSFVAEKGPSIILVFGFIITKRRRRKI